MVRLDPVLAVAHAANAAFWVWAAVSGVCAEIADIDAVELGFRQSLPIGIRLG